MLVFSRELLSLCLCSEVGISGQCLCQTWCPQSPLGMRERVSSVILLRCGPSCFVSFRPARSCETNIEGTIPEMINLPGLSTHVLLF